MLFFSSDRIKRMIKKINWPWLLKIVLPYLIIIACSLVSTYVLFFTGLAEGDDLYFHLGMIEDIYLGFLDGQFGLSTNHYLYGGFALDTFGFYGPFRIILPPFFYIVSHGLVRPSSLHISFLSLLQQLWAVFLLTILVEK